MKQVAIENPVINSPFEEPKRYFLFSEEGITNEILEAWREVFALRRWKGGAFIGWSNGG